MANVSFDLGEAAVRQRLSRARRLFRALYLLESGETIVPERPNKPLKERRAVKRRAL